MKKHAFSLVELLVVMAMMILLAALLVPAANSILRGSQLASAGQAVADHCLLARQDATARNRTVEVRFFQDEKGTCGLGSYLVQDDATFLPLTRLRWLPDGVRLNTTRTSVNLNTFSSNGTTNVPSRGTTTYFAFAFRADGSLSSTTFTTNNPTLTLINQGDSEADSKNFYTLQFDPVTGRAAVYRP